MLIAGSILCAVLVLTVVRPRNLNVAWFAGSGAILAILAGLISLSTLQTIFATTWDASATLIALFLLSETLDSNGFFSWAALLLARYARGSGWLLYLLMLILTTIVTALLANDGAILMLTPIFVKLLQRVYPAQPKRWLAFLFATGFFADAMSGLFIPSNLTNIIIADAMNLEFTQFALRMSIPTLFAFIVGALLFGLRFRQQLHMPYDTLHLEAPQTAIIDKSVFWVSCFVLLGLLVGYIIGSTLHLPISAIAGSAALFMLIIVHIRKISSVPQVLAAAPWSILVYALGMFVVITAAFQSGVLSFLTQPLQGFVHANATPTQTVIAGSILAGLSALVNNLPATLIGVLVLKSVEPVNTLAIYAITLGVDIGPKFTPFGSLATLLWLDILARHQTPISWLTYFRENWWITILVLTAALSGLLLLA